MSNAVGPIHTRTLSNIVFDSNGSANRVAEHLAPHLSPGGMIDAKAIPAIRDIAGREASDLERGVYELLDAEKALRRAGRHNAASLLNQGTSHYDEVTSLLRAAEKGTVVDPSASITAALRDGQLIMMDFTAQYGHHDPLRTMKIETGAAARQIAEVTEVLAKWWAGKL